MRRTDSRRHYAYEILRDRILSLQLRPDDAILEMEVALELGISRTPVREAVIALERDRLVRIVRGKGAFVDSSSGRRVVEVYEVRQVLEGRAVWLATGRISADEVQPFRETFQGYLDGTVTDQDRVLAAADQLHQLIARRSNNSHLQQLLQELSEPIKRLRVVSSNRSNRLTESCREHVEVIDAILSKDCDHAESAMRAHIRAVAQSLAELIHTGFRQ